MMSIAISLCRFNKYLWNMIFKAILVCLLLANCHEIVADTDPISTPTSFEHKVTLMSDFDLEWTAGAGYIIFKIRAKTTGWVGLGIHKPGVIRGMRGADIVMAGVYDDGTNYIFDTIGIGNTRPKLDQSQDVTLLSADEKDGYTTVLFRRTLSGNGDDDVAITPGMVGVLFAYDVSADPQTVQQAKYHFRKRGIMSLDLLKKPFMPDPSMPVATVATAETESMGEELDHGDHDHGGEDGEGDCTDEEGEEEEDPVEGRGEVEEMELHVERSFTSGTGRMKIDWNIKDGNITFEVSGQTRGWMGIGFSEVNGMTNADIIMFGYDDKGPYLYDAFAIGNFVPIVEASQDVHLLSGMENGTHTTVKFTRYLEVSDQFDIKSIKTAGKLFFIYAMGIYDLVGGPSPVNYHFLNRGSVVTDLTHEDGSEDDIYYTGDDFDSNTLYGGQQYLDDDKTVLLKWANDIASVNITLMAPTTGWMGFGLASRMNSMANSDIVMTGVRPNGEAYIVDTFAKRNGAPARDRSKDVELLSHSQTASHTTVTFRKKYLASEKSDRDITDGPMTIIWAYGPRDITNGIPKSGGYHGKNRGSASVQLVHPFLRSAFYPKSGKVVLDEKSEVILQWSVDFEMNIFYQLGALTNGWVGFGISPGKNMRQADMAMMGVRNGKSYVFDVWAGGNRVPRVDKSQDVEVLVSQETDERTIVFFKRSLKAKERKFDRMISEGPLNVIWAFGEKDVVNRPLRSNYHGPNKGFTEIKFIPKMDGNTEEDFSKLMF